MGGQSLCYQYYISPQNQHVHQTVLLTELADEDFEKRTPYRDTELISVITELFQFNARQIKSDYQLIGPDLKTLVQI